MRPGKDAPKEICIRIGANACIAFLFFSSPPHMYTTLLHKIQQGISSAGWVAASQGRTWLHNRFHIITSSAYCHKLEYMLHSHDRDVVEIFLEYCREFFCPKSTIFFDWCRTYKEIYCLVNINGFCEQNRFFLHLIKQFYTKNYSSFF